MEVKTLNNEIILILGSAGMLFLVASIITFIYLYQRKLIKRKIAYQEIENLLHQQELKSAYALLEGQDMERQRIAEEIHDNLGSIHVTLAMYAHSLSRASSEEEKNNLAEKISGIARQATEEARKISHRLDSASLKHFGLQAAINDLVRAVNDSGAVAVEANIELSSELSNESSLNLYRILQELVNNTLKHAHATKITIDISQISHDHISMIYEDNGIGFHPGERAHKGMGLRNIMARAEKLNAQINFGEQTGSGFSVAFEIPCS